MSRHGHFGCEHCNWNGYTKHSFFNGKSVEVSVTPCSVCKDTRGYNLYIKQKYGKENTLKVLEGRESVADVIDFQKYKDSQEILYYSKDEIKYMGERQFQDFGEIPRLQKS